MCSKSVIKSVKLSELEVDFSYQREPTVGRVRKIASNWNPLSAGIMTVNVRPSGKKVIVDANHRREAALSLGIKEWRAEIHYLKTIAEEAELFLLKNTSLSVSSVTTYFAEVTAKDPSALEIKEQLEERGFHIKLGNTKDSSQLQAIGSVKFLHSSGVLKETLNFIDDCWPGDCERNNGMFLKAIGKFLTLSKKCELFDRSRAIMILRRERPDMLKAKAKVSHGHVDTATGNLMAQIYNHNLKLESKKIPLAQ